MIVRTLEECEAGERKVKTDQWQSVRMLLKDDKMGFSFHITTIFEGEELHMHYKNHLESVYCLEGEGQVETVDDGKVYDIKPGTIYILDQHDKHILRCTKQLKFACVFNPPVTGKEVHDETGAYPADTE